MIRVYCPTAAEMLCGLSAKLQKQCWTINTKDGYTALIMPAYGAWSIQTSDKDGSGAGTSAITKLGGWWLAWKMIRRHRRIGEW